MLQGWSISWSQPTSLSEPRSAHTDISVLLFFFPPRFISFSISGGEIPTPPSPAVLFRRIQSSAAVVEPSTPFLPLKSPLQFPQRSSSFFHTPVLSGGELLMKASRHPVHKQYPQK